MCLRPGGGGMNPARKPLCPVGRPGGQIVMIRGIDQRKESRIALSYTKAQGQLWSEVRCMISTGGCPFNPREEPVDRQETGPARPSARLFGRVVGTTLGCHECGFIVKLIIR